VCYQEFLKLLEKAVEYSIDNNNNINNNNDIFFKTSSNHNNFVYGSGYDGLNRNSNNFNNNYSNNNNNNNDDNNYFNSNNNNNNFNTTNASNSLNRFRNSLTRQNFNKTNNFSPYPLELEDGSIDDYYQQQQLQQQQLQRSLSPPKLTDSINNNSFIALNRTRNNNYNNHATTSPYRNRGNNYNSNNDRDLYSTNSNLNTSRISTMELPRSSPSKIGSKMWGTDTPLNKKGESLWVDHNKWCCAVCLYCENLNNVLNCVVCDSPNYNLRKVFFFFFEQFIIFLF
jgi:hypothetical protein